MLAAILVAILIISFFDLRKIIEEKQPNAFATFVVLAIGTIIYGYYYSTHVYTASIIGTILNLFNVK